MCDCVTLLFQLPPRPQSSQGHHQEPIHSSTQHQAHSQPPAYSAAGGMPMPQPIGFGIVPLFSAFVIVLSSQKFSIFILFMFIFCANGIYSVLRHNIPVHPVWVTKVYTNLF